MLRRYHLILDQFGWRYPLGGEALLKHRTRYAVFLKIRKYAYNFNNNVLEFQ